MLLLGSFFHFGFFGFCFFFFVFVFDEYTLQSYQNDRFGIHMIAWTIPSHPNPWEEWHSNFLAFIHLEGWHIIFSPTAAAQGTWNWEAIVLVDIFLLSSHEISKSRRCSLRDIESNSVKLEAQISGPRSVSSPLVALPQTNGESLLRLRREWTFIQSA